MSRRALILHALACKRTAPRSYRLPRGLISCRLNFDRYVLKTLPICLCPGGEFYSCEEI